MQLLLPPPFLHWGLTLDEPVAVKLFYYVANIVILAIKIKQCRVDEQVFKEKKKRKTK